MDPISLAVANADPYPLENFKSQGKAMKKNSPRSRPLGTTRFDSATWDASRRKGRCFGCAQDSFCFSRAPTHFLEDSTRIGECVPLPRSEPKGPNSSITKKRKKAMKLKLEDIRFSPALATIGDQHKLF